MKVLVCVKAVPSYVTRFKLSDDKQIEFESGPMVINESDEYAVEQALILKKQFGGDITVMSAGPPMAQDVLYLGIAKGADKAVRVDTTVRDSDFISLALAAAVKKIGPDIVLTGVESGDNMASRVGISVAERLGMPFAFAVNNVDAGRSPGRIKVTREMGGGYIQVLEIALPAVLCIQSVAVRLSYAPFRKLMEARKKPVESFTLAALGINEAEARAGAPGMVELFSPKRGYHAEMIEGKPIEVSRAILKKIREL